jgi:hypothetical protein
MNREIVSLSLKIECDNHAFNPEAKHEEVIRILKELILKFDRRQYLFEPPLLDINGNLVGNVTLEYEKTFIEKIAEKFNLKTTIGPNADFISTAYLIKGNPFEHASLYVMQDQDDDPDKVVVVRYQCVSSDVPNIVDVQSFDSLRKFTDWFELIL